MKQEKQLLLDEIKREIQQFPSFLVTQYAKLPAIKANEFRREMAKIGVSFEVVRKRVLVKAAENIGVKVSLDTLPGHIGLILAKNDPVEAAKAVLQYSKSNDDCFQLLGGRVEGHMINAADMKRLSELPSKKEMQAQLLGLFEAPMSQTLAVIEALLSSVVYCLDNKSKETEKDAS
jgi:large subunit ribosomal protein L10